MIQKSKNGPLFMLTSVRCFLIIFFFLTAIFFGANKVEKSPFVLKENNLNILILVLDVV
jgi:hypothetical protein